MNIRTVRQAVLGFAILATGTLAAHSATQTARAGSTPTITAIADTRNYGVLEVAGNGFGSRDPVQIQVLESRTGTWHTVASTSAGRSGAFIAVFSFAVSCSAQAASQVGIQVVDMATHEATATVLQTLGTPRSLADAQLAGAKTAQQIAGAQAAVTAANAAMLANAAAC